jgi:uncharacterized protein (DUF1778 family)
MKTDRIEIRINGDVKEELKKVANYLGISLSAFMIMSSIEKASKVDITKEKK